MAQLVGASPHYQKVAGSVSVRARAWVGSPIPGWGVYGGQWIDDFL